MSKVSGSSPEINSGCIVVKRLRINQGEVELVGVSGASFLLFSLRILILFSKFLHLHVGLHGTTMNNDAHLSPCVNDNAKRDLGICA
jgi:hypothetical protein